MDKVDERLERLEEGCSGKALDEKIQEIVQNNVTELWEEKVEKEKRELNLIFTNIPESSGEDSAERMKGDMAKIREVIEKICPDIKEDEVKEPTRLGKFNLGSKPRLVRVRVNTIETKKEILKNARKINKDKKEQKEKVYINPDYTVAERKKNKELRETLRQRIENGERDIGIRGGKIVNIQWKSRLIQDDQEHK